MFISILFCKSCLNPIEIKIDKGINLQNFKKRLSSKGECYKHLIHFKWSEGYSCTKCNYTHFIKDKQPYSRICKRCRYDESTTKGTLFDHLRLDMTKAFGMLYEIVTPQKGELCRSASEKKIRVVIAVEHSDGKAGRAYTKVIEHYSSNSLTPIFDSHIKKKTQIVADKWAGYKPLKEKYPNLKQILSDKEQNFKILHIQIRNFKNCLRGTHPYCNNEYMQKYINEYFFRFNRRNHKQTIFDKIVERCMIAKPIKINDIITLRDLNG